MSWKWAQIVGRPLRTLVPTPFKPPTSLYLGKYPALITVEESSSNSDTQTEPYGAMLKALHLKGDSPLILNCINVSKVEVPDVQSSHREYLVIDIEPQCFLRVTSYMVSDMILIQESTIEQAADRYLEWLESCTISIKCNDDFPDRHLKPYVVITAEQAPDTVNVKALISAKYCEAQGVGSQVYLDLERSLFADLIFIAESDKLNQVLASVAEKCMYLRHQNRHLWSTTERLCLLENAISIFSGNGTGPYNSVQTLSSWNDLQIARDTLWPEMLSRSELACFPKKFQITIFSRCLSRYAAGCAHVFHPDEMFYSVFRHVLKDLFPPKEEETYISSIREGIEKVMEEREQSEDRAYFRRLSGDMSYWNLVKSPKICFACILRPCTYSAPCSHALCEECYSIVTKEEAVREGEISAKGCPYCKKAFNEWKKVTPFPEGTFLKGKMIHKYYDLALTLLEVGLQLRNWNSNEWIPTLSGFVKVALKRPEIWLELVGGWNITWRKLVQLAGRQCPVQLDAIHHSLQKAFGIDILPSTTLGKNPGMETVAWNLIAKLFSFKLIRIAPANDKKFKCTGAIHCHPACEKLASSVAKLLNTQTNFRTHDSCFTYRSPCTVQVLLPNLEHTFDIRLASGSLSASIEGFPSNARQIIKAQATGSTVSTKTEARRKRQCETSDILRHWTKRKKLGLDLAPIG